MSNGRIPKGTKKARFVSGPQVILNRGYGSVYGVPSVNGSATDGKARLIGSMLLTDKQFLEMLRDPTIRLATKVAAAVLLVQPWIVDGEDDDFCTLCSKQFEPHRTKLVRSSYRGILRHGWRAFELVYDTITDAPVMGGTRPVLAGVKPLRFGLVDPLVWEDTGDFAGLEVRDTIGNIDYIDQDHAILVNADEDYVGELGHPHLRCVQQTHNKYEKCDEGAQRYDDKVAGGFLAIGYPQGQTKVMENGVVVKKDNDVIAAAFAKSIHSAGFGLYPLKPDPETGEFKEGSWKFDHVMASGGGLQPNFVARLKYLDALKLRTFGIPERAVTEGSFGTKAEAEAHLDVAIVTSTELLEFIVHGVNEGYMKPYCRENKGDEDAAKFVIGSVSEENKAALLAVFTQMLKDPNASKAVYQRTDVEQIMDRLDVPSTDSPQIEIPETPPAPDPNAPAPVPPGKVPASGNGKPVPVPPGKGKAKSKAAPVPAGK